MSGVCIDIWFDHLLLCENPVQTVVLDNDFFNAFYRELAAFDVDAYLHEAQSLAFNLPHFRRVRAGLLQHHWLKNYRQVTTCLKAFESVEARLQHKIQFAQSAFAFIQENQALFQQVFLAFYPQLVAYTKHLCLCEATTPAH